MWFFHIQTATVPTHTGRTGSRCTTSKPKKWSRGWQNLELKHQQPCCAPGSQGRRRSPTFTPNWEGFPQLWLFLVVMSTFHMQCVSFTMWSHYAFHLDIVGICIDEWRILWLLEQMGDFNDALLKQQPPRNPFVSKSSPVATSWEANFLPIRRMGSSFSQSPWGHCNCWCYDKPGMCVTA